MILTVDEYNALEREGKKGLSNRFLEAFQPEFFSNVGFPTRIEDDKEVYKFLDSMHDGRMQWYYEDKNMQYSPTYEEFEIIKEISESIYQVSKDVYGRGVVVKAPMLCSMNLLRRLKYLGANDIPTVFEIGGGTGILGAMIYRLGYRYISTDITQAFYITQNNRWERLYPGCGEECTGDMDGLNEMEGKILHIPYWKLWELRNNDLEADIIVSNHNLAEMNERALRFYLQYAKQLMRNSEYKLFVAQSPGNTRFRKVDYLLSTFDAMGFALLYSERHFAVFALKDKKQIMPVHMGDLMRKESYQNVFPICGNPLDKTAEKIYLAERNMRDEQKVSLKEMEAYFRLLDEHVDSPDEEFIHYCGYSFI